MAAGHIPQESLHAVYPCNLVKGVANQHHIACGCGFFVLLLCMDVPAVAQRHHAILTAVTCEGHSLAYKNLRSRSRLESVIFLFCFPIVSPCVLGVDEPSLAEWQAEINKQQRELVAMQAALPTSVNLGLTALQLSKVCMHCTVPVNCLCPPLSICVLWTIWLFACETSVLRPRVLFKQMLASIFCSSTRFALITAPLLI